MRAASTSLALLSLLALAPAPGCTSDPEALKISVDVSGSCFVNSDCTAPLVCAFQRCHVECVTSRDCDGQLRCVGARELERVCQLEVEASCQTSADCVAGFVCGQDGACRDTCTRDQECVGDQSCVRGLCAEPNELDERGDLPQTLAHSSCRLASDCGAASICAAGTCRAECRTDRDCGPLETCRDNGCQPVEVEAPCACRVDVDCSAGQTCDGCACQDGPAPECATAADCGEDGLCVNGACECRCALDRDCPAAHRCDGCACQPDEISTVVHDATLVSSLDVELMRGITEVETALTLTGGELRSTEGLSQLHTVGTLAIDELYVPVAARDKVLLGLSGLRLIRGQLRIDGGNLTALPLPTDLRIDGGVAIEGSEIPCAEVGALEQRLHALYPGTKPSVVASFSGGCPGDCVAGACVPW